MQAGDKEILWLPWLGKGQEHLQKQDNLERGHKALFALTFFFLLWPNLQIAYRVQGYSEPELTSSISQVPCLRLEGDVHRTWEQPQFVISLGAKLWNLSCGLLISLSLGKCHLNSTLCSFESTFKGKEVIFSWTTFIMHRQLLKCLCIH